MEKTTKKTNKIIGPKLFPWQADIIKEIKKAGPNAQKIFVCKSKRQCGKSFLAEQELIRHSIETPKSTSILISLTYASCYKIFKELEDFLKGAPFIEDINNSSMIITFKNKSKIRLLSALSGDNLRGLTVTNGGILILDECAYLKDEIFAIVLPYTNFYKTNTLLISTPRTKHGIFYEYYKQGIENPNGSIVSFDMAKYDTSAVLPPEKIELFRKILPKSAFISEIIGEFVDELGGVFDLSKNIFGKTHQNRTNDLFIGIDWGTGQGNDFTVVSAFDSAGNQVGCDYINSLQPTEQIKWITNIVNSKYSTYKIQDIICEKNSIGTVYLDLLKKSLGSKYKITEFVTSNESKREIIEYMIQRINEETVSFLDDPEIYNQLGAYQIEITSSGKITYNGFGAHDDIVMASAFALYGIKSMERNSNYKISFGGTNKYNKKSYIGK